MKLNTLNVNHKQLMTYKKKLLPLPIPTEAQCISEYGEITDNELQELLNIKKNTCIFTHKTDARKRID